MNIRTFSFTAAIDIYCVSIQLCEDMDTTASRLGLKKTVSNIQPVVTDTDTVPASDIDHDDDNNDSTNEPNNETSVLSPSETSFPRRSLRKQGIGPLEDGLPYYETTRSHRQRRASATDGKSDEERSEHPVNHSECHNSEGEGSKDATSDADVDTEHNLSSEVILNTSSVTGKCQSFMVKNLLDLKSPQDSIPPVNFSTPTNSVTANGPVIPNGRLNEPASTSTNSAASLQKGGTKVASNPHSSLHTSELMDTTGSQVTQHTTSSQVTQELPIVNKHQLRQIFLYAVQSTDKTTVSHLEKLHNCLEHAIFRHRMKKNKNILLEVSINQYLYLSIIFLFYLRK